MRTLHYLAILMKLSIGGLGGSLCAAILSLLVGGIAGFSLGLMRKVIAQVQSEDYIWESLEFYGAITCASYGAIGGLIAGAVGLVTEKSSIGIFVGGLAGLASMAFGLMLSGVPPAHWGVEGILAILGTTLGCALSGRIWAEIGQALR